MLTRLRDAIGYVVLLGLLVACALFVLRMIELGWTR